MPINDADKLECLEHVFYEAYQMYKAVEFCSPLAKRSDLTLDESARKDLFLEGHLLHMRALRDFFEKSIPKKPREPLSGDRADQVSADYGFGPIVINFAPNIKDRLDKEIAHLSYHRLKANNIHPKEWSSKDTIDVISPHIWDFSEHVIKQYHQVAKGIKETIDGREVDHAKTAFYMDIVRKFAKQQMTPRVKAIDVSSAMVNIYTTGLTAYIPNNGLQKPPGTKPSP